MEKGSETSKMKKSWSEPALIVLVRGKPEEAILGVCKDDGVPSTGLAVTNAGCDDNHA